MIRLMEKAHVASVAELERACFGAPWSEQSLLHLIGTGGFAVVAVEDGRVVAYGGMMTVLDEGQITNIATDPRYRRRGFADAVLAKMIDEARCRGLATLSLEVRVGNAAAIALYQKHGFREVGLRRGFYTHPREDAAVMTMNV